MKDQTERGGTRSTLRCVGGGELADHVTIVKCDKCDMFLAYVDCVEVCHNELEMEKANGQELDGLRVGMKKGDSPSSAKTDISRFVLEQRTCLSRSLSLAALPSARVTGRQTSAREAATTALDLM